MKLFRHAWNWSPSTFLLGLVCVLILMTSIVWSQGQNFPGGSGPAVNGPGIPSFAGKNIIYATNFGVKSGGYKFCDANVAASSSGVVTIGNDANLVDPSLLTLGITTSWIAWVSTYNCSGYNTTFNILNTQGTVVSVNSATSITISTLSAGTCNGTFGGTTNKCTLYLFPQDDSTAMAAWVTAVSAPGVCGIGVLPAGLTLISTYQATQLQAGCAADNTGNGSWPGIAFTGPLPGNVSGAVLVVSPNLNTSTCPGAGGTFPCLFEQPPSASKQNDLHFADFSIDGGGDRTPTGHGINQAGLALFADSTATDIGMIAWGICEGITTNGSDNAPVTLSHIFMAAVGSQDGAGCGSIEALQSTTLDHSNLFWCNGYCIYTQGNTYGANHFSYNQFGDSQNIALVNVISGGLAFFEHNYINLPSGSNNLDAYQINGEAYFDNEYCPNGFVSSNGNRCFHVTSTGKAHVKNSKIDNASLTGVGVLVDSGGIYLDGCGNENSSVTPYTINGTYINESAADGGCSQNYTPLATGNLVLSGGWGVSAATSAWRGGNSPVQFTITNGASGVGATPTITYTFPNVFPVAPISCTATDLAGTNPLLNPFSTSSLTATGAIFTATGTPTISDTEIMQVTCILP